MPFDHPADPARAAPCFEIYGEVSASPYAEACWTILFERFDNIITACNQLGQRIPRAALVADTLAFLRRNLVQAKEASS
ncbi:MAG: hypothetical protein HC869_27475 [Rhodospirillales bacterium]|nr:hypothetical protein [Rhodospirillales bacterium]